MKLALSTNFGNSPLQCVVFCVMTYRYGPSHADLPFGGVKCLQIQGKSETTQECVRFCGTPSAYFATSVLEQLPYS